MILDLVVDGTLPEQRGVDTQLPASEPELSPTQVFDDGREPLLKFRVVDSVGLGREVEHVISNGNEPLVERKSGDLLKVGGGRLDVPASADALEFTHSSSGIIDVLQEMRANDKGKRVVLEGKALHVTNDKRPIYLDALLIPLTGVVNQQVAQNIGSREGSRAAAHVEHQGPGRNLSSFQEPSTVAEGISHPRCPNQGVHAATVTPTSQMMDETNPYPARS